MLDRRDLRSIVIAALVALLAAGCGSSGGDPSPSEAVRAALLEIRDGDRPITELVVTYDDLHPLHGGETFTVRGDRLEAAYLDPGAAAELVQPQAVTLTGEGVRGLLDELVAVEAWEQRVPEREPFPDESRAYLTVTVGEASTTIWEWYNDLSGNDRIVRVKSVLEAVAPDPTGS
jgi:hypothetical protein